MLFKSKSGFTKRYASWISEELHADLIDMTAKRVDVNTLLTYDTIIYGGGLYASGIHGVKFIIANANKLTEKKLIVFATGVAPARKDVVHEVRDKNIPSDLRDNVSFFYLRGGFDFTKLTPIDKILMTLLKWKITIKKRLKIKLVQDENGMLAAYSMPVDYTRKRNIRQLVLTAEGQG